MTPNIEEYQIQSQSLEGPDFSLASNFVDKRLDKNLTPNIASNPISNEILYMRGLGDRISDLRRKAVQIELDRTNSRRSKIASFISIKVNELLGLQPQGAITPEVDTKIKRDILVERESLAGGLVFGATERGVTRRFFYDDTAQNQAWFFMETAPQADRSLRYDKDMRYEIHDNGVLEVARIEDNQNQQGYHYAWQYIDAAEYNNLRVASELYYQQIVEKIYKPDYGITD